jgi:hypothetical protein
MIPSLPFPEVKGFIFTASTPYLTTPPSSIAFIFSSTCEYLDRSLDREAS